MRKLVFSAVLAFVLSFALYSQASAATETKNVVTSQKTGWVYSSEGPDGYSWYYYKSGGVMATGWNKINGYWYYFYENGRMATGWIVFNNSTAEYYADKNGRMQTGWVKVGYQWVYFQSNGLYKAGWINDNGTWYYQNKNGMVTGWLYDNGAWYFLKSSGAMQTGWANVNGTWYYFNKTGAMKTGWFSSNGTWYYLNTNGSMQTGWADINEKHYYFDRNGAMKTGWLQLEEGWYYLYSNGAMAVNTIIDGYQIGEDGIWIQDDAPDQAIEDMLSEIASQYGLTVEYNDNTEEFELFDGEWFVGGIGLTGSIGYPGYVYADPAYTELIIKLAIAAGASVSEERLQELVLEAEQTGELNSDGVTILSNEENLVIMWGFGDLE